MVLMLHYLASGLIVSHSLLPKKKENGWLENQSCPVGKRVCCPFCHGFSNFCLSTATGECPEGHWGNMEHYVFISWFLSQFNSFGQPLIANLPSKASRRKRRRRHSNNNATSMKSKSNPASVPTKGATVQPSNGERRTWSCLILWRTPINDHQTTKEGDEHGVTYHTSDKQEWTPVVRKRRKHPAVHRRGPGSLQEDCGSHAWSKYGRL